MEKLIKIKARMIDGSIEKYRVTSFTVKPFRNAEGLYLTLDDHYTFACKSIEVEQKEVVPVNAEHPFDKFAEHPACHSNYPANI